MFFLFNKFAGNLISEEAIVFTILSVICLVGCCGFGLISSKKKNGKKRGKKKKTKNKSNK